MNFLLVDDDADDAEMFSEALSRVAPQTGFQTTDNGLGLFEILPGHKPDVIFLDINMPKMGGWDCLRKLKTDNSYQDIPVIMYSTSSARSDIDKAYELGAFLFITKPEDYTELLKILEVVSTGLQEPQVNKLKQFRSIKFN